jgi:hypothetical protein
MSLGNEWKFDSPRELDEFLLPLPNKNEKGDNSIYTCDANAPRWTTFWGWKKSSFRGGGKNQIWNQLTAELPQPIPFPVVLVSSVTALYLIVWIGLYSPFIIWVSNSQANLSAIFLFKPFFFVFHFWVVGCCYKSMGHEVNCVTEIYRKLFFFYFLPFYYYVRQHRRHTALLSNRVVTTISYPFKRL